MARPRKRAPSTVEGWNSIDEAITAVHAIKPPTLNPDEVADLGAYRAAQEAVRRDPTYQAAQRYATAYIRRYGHYSPEAKNYWRLSSALANLIPKTLLANSVASI